MTDVEPVLVVFGIDGEGKPRAARFANRDAELVIKAAALLGFRTAWFETDPDRTFAKGLPEGTVFTRGIGLCGPFGSPFLRGFPPLSIALASRAQSPRARTLITPTNTHLKFEC